MGFLRVYCGRIPPICQDRQTEILAALSHELPIWGILHGKMSTPMPLSDNTETVASSHYALVASRDARLRDLLPAHRLPVIAKTPIMVALGAYFAHADFARPELWLTFLISALLWTSLYALNEMTDVSAEQGLYVPPKTQKVLYTLPFVVCAASLFLSKSLFVCLFTMTVGQYAYCVPKFRLKRYWITIVLLSGVVNPLLRMECGAIWGTQQMPVLAGAVFVLLHLGATFRARTLQRERDRKLAYRTAPPFSDWLGPVCTALGLTGAILLCLHGILPHFFFFYILIAAGFAVYAWSGRVHSMNTLRRGWIGFALLGLIAVAILMAAR